MPSRKTNQKGAKDVVKTARPLNLEEEKRIFFADFSYNPQFTYEASEEKIQKALNRYEIPADKYVAHSRRVLENVLQKYGSYEEYRNAGGEIIDELTCRGVCQEYLSAHNLEDVSIVFDDALVARASITKFCITFILTFRFFWQTLRGSFSAVSKPNFASKY